MVERAFGQKLTKDELGGTGVHRRSAVVHNEAQDEADALGQAQRFLSYLPRSVYHLAPVLACDDDPMRADDWLKDAKNQAQVRRFLRASQRGWQYTFDNRDEAAEIFMRRAPAFNKEISLLEINGTMTILHTEKTKGKPIAWSDAGDWKDSQDLLEKFANYGFNKSHAAAYAVVSYQTGWLKANHPVEFMSGVMNCDIHLTDKLAVYKRELDKLGIKTVAPCVVCMTRTACFNSSGQF